MACMNMLNLCDAAVLGSAAYFWTRHPFHATVIAGVHGFERCVLPALAAPNFKSRVVLFAHMVMSAAAARSAFLMMDTQFLCTETVACLVAAAIVRARAEAFQSSLAWSCFIDIVNMHPDLVGQLVRELHRILALVSDRVDAEQASSREAMTQAAREALDLHAPLRCNGNSSDGDPPIVGEGEPQCSICLEDIDRQLLHRRLPCGHAFHPECVDGWFSIYANPTCPICKRLVVPKAQEE